MKVMILSGGNLQTDFLKKQITTYRADKILCADGGAQPLFEAKIIPDVLLGDFDSISSEVFNFFINQGVKVVRFNCEKDQTDTEIALDYAINLGATDIVLLGGTGTRLDHTLANIMILEKYCRLAICKIIDPHNEIEVLQGIQTTQFEKQNFKYISLIPLSKKVLGVTTQGLKYPLKDATLLRKESFGISNEIIEDPCTLQMSKGTMVVIRSCD
ncbi:MAG: thiamine diphosphokinase [Vallitaleaceae bacterium]|nr:thiamine diphosphokinase [Vallitaleaceae bacterium]